MKKSNPLFGFKKKGSSTFPTITKVLTDSDARVSKYNESTARQKTTAIYSLLKSVITTTGDMGNEFFVGKTRDGKYIAELASISRPDMVSVALYEPKTGSLKATAIDKVTRSTKPYIVADGTPVDEESHFVSDGTVIWLALLPVILQDEEAATAASLFHKYYDEAGISEHDIACKEAGRLSDNVYLRLTGGLSTSSDPSKRAAHINLYDNDQPSTLLANQLNNTENIAHEKLYGHPILTSPGKATFGREIKEGEFNLGVPLSAKQKEHLRELPAGHVTSHTEVRMLEVIKRTYGTKRPVQNLLLEGPPGTGKSRSALAVAHHLGLPYYTFICSDGTTEDDLLGCILPVPQSRDNTQLKNFPTPLEMEFDSVASYSKLTGKNPEDISEEDLPMENLRLANNALRDMVEKGTSGAAISYDYFPSTIVTAFRDGGVIEIQEPSAIASASVLSCLNDIMNSSDGIINTPYGSIKRHPNCFVIATTNPDTNGGYGKLNEAVRNRFQRTYKVDLPSPEEMVERAMKMGLMSDEFKCHVMAEAIQYIDTAIKENGIQGQAGMRCFYEWCQDVEAGEDMRESLAECVINNVTTNADEQEILFDTITTNTTLLS